MDNDSTNVSQVLQEDLAEYGILRAEAIKNAPVKSSGVPNFFGLKYGFGEAELLFDTDIKTIQDRNMQVAIVAPDNETFDMLVTTNFQKAVTKASPDQLRSFIRNILRKA